VVFVSSLQIEFAFVRSSGEGVRFWSYVKMISLKKSTCGDWALIGEEKYRLVRTKHKVKTVEIWR
jgi:hypothetical protein